MTNNGTKAHILHTHRECSNIKDVRINIAAVEQEGTKYELKRLRMLT